MSIFMVDPANKEHFHVKLNSIGLRVVDPGRGVKFFFRSGHLDSDCLFGEIFALILDFFIGIYHSVVLCLSSTFPCPLSPVGLNWPLELLVNVGPLSED